MTIEHPTVIHDCIPPSTSTTTPVVRRASSASSPAAAATATAAVAPTTVASPAAAASLLSAPSSTSKSRSSSASAPSSAARLRAKVNLDPSLLTTPGAEVDPVASPNSAGGPVVLGADGQPILKKKTKTIIVIKKVIRRVKKSSVGGEPITPQPIEGDIDLSPAAPTTPKEEAPSTPPSPLPSPAIAVVAVAPAPLVSVSVAEPTFVNATPLRSPTAAGSTARRKTAPIPPEAAAALGVVATKAVVAPAREEESAVAKQEIITPKAVATPKNKSKAKASLVEESKEAEDLQPIALAFNDENTNNSIASPKTSSSSSSFSFQPTKVAKKDEESKMQMQTPIVSPRAVITPMTPIRSPSSTTIVNTISSGFIVPAVDDEVRARSLKAQRQRDHAIELRALHARKTRILAAEKARWEAVWAEEESSRQAAREARKQAEEAALESLRKEEAQRVANEALLAAAASAAATAAAKALTPRAAIARPLGGLAPSNPAAAAAASASSSSSSSTSASPVVGSVEDKDRESRAKTEALVAAAAARKKSNDLEAAARAKEREKKEIEERRIFAQLQKDIDTLTMGTDVWKLPRTTFATVKMNKLMLVMVAPVTKTSKATIEKGMKSSAFAIRWSTHKSNAADATLILTPSSIQIHEGQGHGMFPKKIAEVRKKAGDDRAKFSFTIETQTRSLDVVCMSLPDYDRWIKFLKMIKAQN